MQCPNCKFENIPGQTKCFQCGCVLEGKAPIDVNPPRMPRRQRPFRALRRAIRKTGASNITVPEWLEFLSYHFIGSLLLSLIPGVGHAVQKRFSQIRWIVLLWLFLLAAGIFFLGSPLGVFLLSAAIGTHGYIIVDCMLLDGAAKKLTCNLLTAILMYYLYCIIIWRVVLGLFGSYGAVDIPAMRIEREDYFISHRFAEGTAVFRRGDFATLEARTLFNNNYSRNRRNFMAACQIVGLPNETIEVKDGVFLIDGVALDKDIYPVQEWISTYYFKTTLGNNQYFVNIIYNARYAIPSATISSACIFDGSQFNGRALAKWQPWYERIIFRD